MKKFLMLLLAAMLVLTVSFAAAEQLGDSALDITLPDGVEACELEEEDIEDGVIAIYVNEDESLEIVVYMYEAECTLQEIEAEILEEEPETELEYTNINGVDALCEFLAIEDARAIVYYIVDGDVELNIMCMFADDAAGQLSQDIMNTLVQAQ